MNYLHCTFILLKVFIQIIYLIYLDQFSIMTNFFLRYELYEAFINFQNALIISNHQYYHCYYLIHFYHFKGN